MSELVQIKGHNQVLTHENAWVEKSSGKKLILIDLANCEDMSIKKRRSINVYGFPVGIMCLATYLKKSLTGLDESAKGLYAEFQFCETPLLSKEFMKKFTIDDLLFNHLYKFYCML